MKKTISILLALALLAAMLLPALAEGYETYTFTIHEINKHGNVVLAYYGNNFAELGFEYGDLISVSFGGRTLDMPVGSSYSDVDDGHYICRLVLADENENSAVVLALRNASMAAETGLTADAELSITMKEKGGYLDEYLARQLIRSASRADYAALDDEAYANFRMVATTGIAPYVLYRSSSPIDPSQGRSKEADTALNNAGVACILNLAEDENGMRQELDYPQSYYADRTVICANLPSAVGSEAFETGMADALRFLIANDGPYLIHCLLGQDRTGFVCAVLEALMGASLDEVVADYMQSYVNYYGILPGSARYDLLAENTLLPLLHQAFGEREINAATDLAANAAEYLGAIGLTEAEIDQLRTRLSQEI